MRLDARFRYGFSVVSVAAALALAFLIPKLPLDPVLVPWIVALTALVLPLAGFHLAGRFLAISSGHLRRFLSGFEEVPIPMLVVDGDLRIVIANRPFRDLLGVTAEALIGRKVLEVLPGEWGQRFRNQYDSLAGGKTRSICEQDWLPRAGQSSVYLRIRSLSMPDKGFERIVSFCEDLTEARHIADAQTQWSERVQAFVQRLIDVIPQPVYLKDAQSRLILVNDAYVDARGESRESLLGKTPYDLASEPGHGDISYQEDQRVLAGGSVIKEETAVDGLSGEVVYRIITKGACLDAAGNPVIVGANFDVTPWRRAEQQLMTALQRETDRRERTQKYVQRLIDMIPQPVYVKDAQSRFVMINEAFSSEWGLPREKLIGHSTQELAPGNPRSILSAQEDKDVLNGAMIHKEECSPHWSSGEERYRIITKGLCLNDEGRAVIVGANFDVTELRQTERSLQAALDVQSRTRAFLQTLFDALPNPVSVKDMNRRYLMTNRAWESAFGLSEEMLFEQQPGGHTDACSDEKLQKLFSLIEQSDGSVREEEVSIGSMDNEQSRHYIARGTVTSDLDGNRVLLCVLSDITSIKHAEAHSIRARESAEQANEAKSRFLANMSHELRTPMHAVLSFARLGEEKTEATPELARFHGYFDRIVRSGERLMALLNDLLDLSKLESGRLEVKRVPVDLSTVLSDARAEFSALFSSHQQTLAVTAGDAVRVLGNEALLGQVLRNLLSNAVKFSPEGACIDVSLRVSHDGDEPMAELVVADRGVGIPEEELESVFDKFVQSSTTRTGAGGTGLGLAICREIITLHGGYIFARNREGGGAEFVMQLPVVSEAAE